MNRIIITAIGVDKPGLVNKITSIINQNNGNIENSKMIKIEDQFAIIIDFSCLENLDNMKSKLDLIQDLKISYKVIKRLDVPSKSSATYLIKGADDQGIINTISNYFKDNNLNIVEIDTFTEAAPITGSPLFNMRVTIEYNHSTDLNKIRENLYEICSNLNLTLD